MRGFGAKIILDWADNDRIYNAQTMDRLGVKVGGESHVKGRNKYLIKFWQKLILALNRLPIVSLKKEAMMSKFIQ